MDPMSDVLSGMHVRRFGYARLEANAPWGLSFRKHSASLGMVLEGNCWLTMARIPQPIALKAGDCYLIVHGDAHALRDHPDSSTRPFSEVFVVQPGMARVSGNGASSIIVGGWFHFDRLSSQPLTKILPPLIHIQSSRVHELGLDATLRSLANETRVPGPGIDIVVNRLAEVLFIQMIRSFISPELAGAPGWLSALADRQIGSALRLMHEYVNRNWIVGDLAQAVGLSRSAFAHRFRKLVGEGPMQYLTNWRIFKASRLIRGSDMRLGQIARSVGYESEAAFCHAFKRVMGVTPGDHRAARGTPERQSPLDSVDVGAGEP
jgi:AraC-like DNA-binding protein